MATKARERAGEDAGKTILVVSDSFHDLAEPVALLAGCGHRIGFVRSLKRLQEIGDDEAGFPLREADAIISGRVVDIDREAIARLERARIIALHTSGVDNVDLAAATERGIVVTSVRGINAAPCADFAMGLILASVRQIVRGDRVIRAGRWQAETGVSRDLGDATLGIIGLGRIGRALAQRAAAFGMELLAHTRTVDEDVGRRYGVRFGTLAEVLERADVVALTASLTAETRGMIGAAELRRMKPTAYFVNVARGEMVDEAALCRALREGWIAGAGIDVFETEPLRSSPLFELDNVVVTPHQAGLTRGGMVGAAMGATRNALRVLAGEEPENVVNPDALRERSRT